MTYTTTTEEVSCLVHDPAEWARIESHVRWLCEEYGDTMTAEEVYSEATAEASY